jgi:hypothetical protein
MYRLCDDFESSIGNEIPLVANGPRSLQMCLKEASQNSIVFKNGLNVV